MLKLILNAVQRHRWEPHLDREKVKAACSILRWPIQFEVVESCEFGGPVLYYPVDDDAPPHYWFHVFEISAEGTPREISRALYRAIMEAAQWEVGIKDRLELERSEDADYIARLVVLAPRWA